PDYSSGGGGKRRGVQEQRLYPAVWSTDRKGFSRRGISAGPNLRDPGRRRSGASADRGESGQSAFYRQCGDGETRRGSVREEINSEGSCVGWKGGEDRSGRRGFASGVERRG